MAQPLKLTRAAVIRLLRRWDDDVRPAAAAAGHQLPSPEYGDGMTRATARAMRQQALKIPQMRAALLSPEGQAFLRMAAYFEAEHPQTATGSPAPWPKSATLSPAMTAFALRQTNAIDPAALLSHEVESLVHYAQARNDPSDFEGERAATVRGEVDRLVAAAEAAAESAPMFAEPPPGQSQQQAAAPPDTPQQQRDTTAMLDSNPGGARPAPIHPRVLREDLDGLSAIQRRLRLKELFGEPLVETGPAPESALRPTVTAEQIKPTPAARAPKPPMAPARLRETLAGLTGGARAAKLTEIFGPLDGGASAAADGAAAAA
jgi:hypothetical protein